MLIVHANLMLEVVHFFSIYDYLFLIFFPISDALTLLGERLQGPHNLEMILLSSNSPNLPIQISDAIMTFQGSGLQVTEKIFAKCGKPRTVMKRDTTSGKEFHKT